MCLKSLFDKNLTETFLNSLTKIVALKPDCPDEMCYVHDCGHQNNALS